MGAERLAGERMIILPGAILDRHGYNDTAPDTITIIAVDYAQYIPLIQYRGSWHSADYIAHHVDLEDVHKWLKEGWHVSTR
jgi:hypothetical protein